MRFAFCLLFSFSVLTISYGQTELNSLAGSELVIGVVIEDAVNEIQTAEEIQKHSRLKDFFEHENNTVAEPGRREAKRAFAFIKIGLAVVNVGVGTAFLVEDPEFGFAIAGPCFAAAIFHGITAAVMLRNN